MFILKLFLVLFIGLQAVQCQSSNDVDSYVQSSVDSESVDEPSDVKDTSSSQTNLQIVEAANDQKEAPIPVNEIIIHTEQKEDSAELTLISESKPIISIPTLQDTQMGLTDTPSTITIQTDILSKNTSDKSSTTEVLPTPSHNLLDGLLKQYVSSSGKVNYKGLKKEVSTLKKYLDQMGNIPPNDSWSKERIMVYWINLYNAMTLYHITNNYPIKSIMNIDNGKIWDTRTIKIGNENLTLNQIEKNKLLKKYRDYHIHFAVNCGAKSFHALLNRAWSEKTLYTDFKQQAKLFIQNSAHNKISSSQLQLSQIFNWYATDFKTSPAYVSIRGNHNNHLVAIIDHYHANNISNNPSINYLEYDWQLNE